jgi:type IV secretion system protein VirB9
MGASMKITEIAIASLLLGATCSVFAVQVPDPSPQDGRVRYVTYKKDDVTYVAVQRGTVTRIVLADDETIQVAATGFPADCAKAGFEWCIRADVGSNQIWVKPEDNATHNNLELHTNKRDYSIEFKVLADSPTGRFVTTGASAKSLETAPMYRVVYRYPVNLPPVSAVLGAAAYQPAGGDVSELKTTLASAAPVAKNWKYSMEVLKGGDEIKPSIVFDDGRFTYFRFPGNRPVPPILYVTPSGEEQHVDFHIDPTDKRLVAVERTGAHFNLRLGQSVVGVWNDGYNPGDVSDDSNSGTTVDGVTRVIR